MTNRRSLELRTLATRDRRATPSERPRLPVTRALPDQGQRVIEHDLILATRRMVYALARQHERRDDPLGAPWSTQRTAIRRPIRGKTRRAAP